MALSRLALIITVYSQFSGAASERAVTEFTFTSSAESLTLQKIYTKNHAVTFFFTPDHQGNIVDFALDASHSACFSEHSMRFGQRDDTDHAYMHQTTTDYEETHAHLIKGDFARITPLEFNCLMRFLKEIEARAGYCADGKTNCLITHHDAEDVVRAYEWYADPDPTEEETIKHLAKKC